MNLTTAQKWRRTLAWLRREFPSRHPVAVRSQRMKIHGETVYGNNRFRIQVNNKQSFSLRIDTIIHEYAHCLVWFGEEQEEEHSAEWGLAYAKVYRAFLLWNFGKR